ncbi:hypothetical protein [Geminisphaera colitermitum]|uniref:hypothetical protein n=1 Tax=Geminisphaera colitermitum TaxID=1148786 RepID=UPI0001964F5A|nr:hypothetical protein [Geminisphaera colitermitum]RRK02407.1 hypothetical protein Ga0100230_004480 [Opitutaceae bacterium TAV3]
MKNAAKNAETIPPVTAAKPVVPFPRPAIWIRPAFSHNWNLPTPPPVARLTILPVDVVAVENGMARIYVIEHGQISAHTVPVDELASSMGKAYPRIKHRISAMLARPALTAVLGTTVSQAETPSFLTPSISGGEHVNAEVLA